MDNYTELSIKYSDNLFIRSVVKIIPYVGGSLDLLLTDKWNKFYLIISEKMLMRFWYKQYNAGSRTPSRENCLGLISSGVFPFYR